MIYIYTTLCVCHRASIYTPNMIEYWNIAACKSSIVWSLVGFAKRSSEGIPSGNCYCPMGPWHLVASCGHSKGVFLQLAWLELTGSMTGWWLTKPLWKISKSIGMIIPSIWKNKECSKHQPDDDSAMLVVLVLHQTCATLAFEIPQMMGLMGNSDLSAGWYHPT